MIIRRYLCRLLTQEIVMFMIILLLIVTSMMFVQYLSRAANGSIAPKDVAQIILFLVPYYISVLLPASVFLATVVVFGRLYSDNELFVMQSSGMSSFKLLKIAFIPGLIATLVVFLLVGIINPLMSTLRQELTAKNNTNSIDMVTPGQFIPFNDNKNVLYLNNNTSHSKNANNVFFYRKLSNGQDQIVTAPEGYSTQNKQTNQHQITMLHGHQYKLTSGHLNFQQVDFKTYTQNLPVFADLTLSSTLESQSIQHLWASPSPQAKIELQWRLSMPLMVIVLTLLSVAICTLKPKESRFNKLLPAFLLFMIYFLLLVVARNWLNQGKIPLWLGLWWVHGLFFLFAAGWILHRDRFFHQCYYQGIRRCGF